jgi:hypothetical protein
LKNKSRQNAIYVVVLSGLALLCVVGFQNCGSGFSASSAGNQLARASGVISDSPSDKLTVGTFSIPQPDTISFNGKTVSFKNDNGAPTTIQLVSMQDTGFVLQFTTPKQRTITQQFKVADGQFINSNVDGIYPQFCLEQKPTDGSDNRCALKKMPTTGATEFNCASALHWSGSFTGDTVSQQATCVPGSPLPVVAAPIATKSSPIQTAVQVANAMLAYANVTLRLSDPATSTIEKQIITQLASAPVQTPPTSYGANSTTINPSDLPQLAMGCSGRTDITVPSGQTPAWGSPVPSFSSLPMRSFSNLFGNTGASDASCTPLGSWCSVSYRGNGNGNTCTASSNFTPRYNCNSSWVLSCKQFCESTMQFLNLPSGHGWVCNYGGYYSDTPNHDPTTYKDTDRRGASWDL